MAHTIEVERNEETSGDMWHRAGFVGYTARIKGQPTLAAGGMNVNEAIGALCRAYPDQLGLTIVRQDRRAAQKTNRTTPHLSPLHR